MNTKTQNIKPIDSALIIFIRKSIIIFQKFTIETKKD